MKTKNSSTLRMKMVTLCLAWELSKQSTDGVDLELGMGTEYSLVSWLA